MFPGWKSFGVVPWLPAAARLPFATPDAALMAAWRDGAAAGLMLDLCYGALPCQPKPAPQA